MGIVLGLAAAVCWGSADLMARYVTRAIGTLRTMLYMQLTGLVALMLVMHWLGGWGHLADGSGWRPWVWGIGAGLLNACGTLALYRSFEIGKMSIVAPISASYPALTLLLAFATGERLTASRSAGVALIAIGVVLVARGEQTPGEDESTEERRPGKNNLGVGWALLSAVGFGVMFWLLGIRVVPMLGSAPAVWLIRLTSLLLTGVVILLARRPVSVPQGKTSQLILSVGILDTSSYVFNNWGMQREQVSVVSVLASLYGAVTVALAATILGEKISRIQWVGILGIFVGIFLISK